ncbi:MAG TPA: alpha/beta hydrolase fold domain-containing protein [Pseudorhodoplanes sp.]|jgi:acetyl esterase|nr:alpha/beta hydrolase fold domain-containing protein [Pseudorhodoplanes sp.]
MNIASPAEPNLTPDPQMETILKRMRAAPVADYRAMSIEKARALFEELAAPWCEPKLPVASVRDLSVPGTAGALRARLYHPQPGQPRPVIVFAHGGGWTFGSVDTHDGTMRHLAHHSGCAVLGMDYRLAPENPFPAGLSDFLASIEFVAGGGLGAEVNAASMALAGDSAGANIALAALLTLRPQGPRIRTAALFYGCYAPIFDTGSNRNCGDGSFGLSTEIMRWYWRNYLGRESETTTSYAAPLRADLAGLPPLYLNCAGLDPLRDDTLLLCNRLADAGVPFRLDTIPGVVHGFLRMTKELPAANEAIRAAGQFLSGALNV